MSTPNPIGSASLSDLLTATKNLVIAVNNLTQTYLNVQGASNSGPISTPTVVKKTGGRVARVSVITAGTSVGMIYDAATLGATTKPLAPIPNTVGVYEINFATSFGIYVNPGLQQQVNVGYS